MHSPTGPSTMSEPTFTAPPLHRTSTSTPTPSAIKKLYRREHKRNHSVPDDMLMNSAFRALKPAPIPGASRLHDFSTVDTSMRDVHQQQQQQQQMGMQGQVRFTTQTHTVSQMTLDFPPPPPQQQRVRMGHSYSASLGGMPYRGPLQPQQRRSSMMHPMQFNDTDFYPHSQQSRAETLPTPPYTAMGRTMSPFDLAPLPTNNYLSMTSMALDASVPVTSGEMEGGYFGMAQREEEAFHGFQFPVSTSAGQGGGQKMQATAGPIGQQYQQYQPQQQQRGVQIQTSNTQAPGMTTSAPIQPKQEQPRS
ncbi:hypothetical protein BJ508DRAFT_334265, partial [Ascobolus immersus RN42]